MDLATSNHNEVLHVSFNQDNSRFAVGTQTGFFVCNTRPLNLCYNRQFDEGIGIVELLYDCNIIALVGGGRIPRYQPNSVVIWDDHQAKSIAVLEFGTTVKAVKMRRDRIVVALESMIFVYNLDDLRILGKHDTAEAKLGLMSVSASSINMVLAFPSLNVGEVCWYSSLAKDSSSKNTRVVTSSALERIAVDPSGTLMAVASGRGTLIRVVKLNGGPDEVTTYRRGTTTAAIQCLAFSSNSAFLACTSDRGTVHIFHLDAYTSTSTYFGMLTGTNEPRAVASHSVRESQSICAFVPSNRDDIGCNREVLVILGGSGRYYLIAIERAADGSFIITDLSEGQPESYLP